MFIAFGVTFEIPIVVVVLVRMGLVNIKQLNEARPYVIVGSFVVAAVVTPPDVLSQLLLAVPMCLLYEMGIILGRFIGKRPDTDPDAAKPADSTASTETPDAAAPAEQGK